MNREQARLARINNLARVPYTAGHRFDHSGESRERLAWNHLVAGHPADDILSALGCGSKDT